VQACSGERALASPPPSAAAHLLEAGAGASERPHALALGARDHAARDLELDLTWGFPVFGRVAGPRQGVRAPKNLKKPAKQTQPKGVSLNAEPDMTFGNVIKQTGRCP
jgi:hypothetical protein